MSDANEQWRPVLGFEGCYEVSNQGRVRGVDRLTRFRGGTRRVRGRLIGQHVNDSGRLVVMLYRDGKCRCLKVHSLVLQAFVGPRPPGMVGCHYDDDVFNNNLSNLRWDTQRANNLDTVRNGNHHNASRTRCRRGHLLSGANLRRPPSGARVCRACHHAHAVVRRALAKGVQLDLATVAEAKYAQIMKETVRNAA